MCEQKGERYHYYAERDGITKLWYSVIYRQVVTSNCNAELQHSNFSLILDICMYMLICLMYNANVKQFRIQMMGPVRAKILIFELLSR